MIEAQFQPEHTLNEANGLHKGTWRSAWARVAGSAHIQRGAGCDDAIAVDVRQIHGESYWFGVVCDGAGSATYGAEGAFLATQATLRCWQAWTEHEQSADPENQTTSMAVHLRKWAKSAHEELNRIATARHSKPRDFACTWICAVAGPDFLCVAQIGDGALVWLEQQEWHVAIWPEQGEYANMTRFLHEPTSIENLQLIMHSHAPQTIIAFSDGLQRLALQYNEKKAFPGFLNPLLNSFINGSPGEEAYWAAQLATWLDSPQVNARTDDDKTFLIARRTE